jgi:small subunit ribosomal protein S5
MAERKKEAKKEEKMEEKTVVVEVNEPAIIAVAESAEPVVDASLQAEVKAKEAEEFSKEKIGKDESEYLKKTAQRGRAKSFDEVAWIPKTTTGKRIKVGEINDIDAVLDAGEKIKESEIVDMLVPDIESDFLLIGQSRGKFGGGKRKIFRQTQKKTREGNKPHFEIMAVVGNKNGYVGLGYGKSKETVPAREKSVRNAKLNLIKVRRGCGSWQCGCREPHSIPYTIEAKCGSVTVKLMPAPKGTGLKIQGESAKILKLAGIRDIWSETRGNTTTRLNVVQACYNALRKLTDIKIQEKHIPEFGIVEGKMK